MKQKINLNDSGVIFNEELHEYHLNGKKLSGITDVIKRQIYPDEFDGIPARILTSAADYGKSVHKSIELFDSDWTNDGTIEVQDYISLCKEQLLHHEASEYLITDGENYASAIDKVYRTGDDTFSIADIKTYYGTLSGSKLDKCRWQLSIYRYLFMLQNPEAKVDRLFVIHIRNREKTDGTFDHVSEVIDVDPIPENICRELLECDLRGEQFANPFAVPGNVISMAQRMKQLMQEKTKAEEEINAIKAEILSSMEFLDVKTWETGDVKLIRKLPGTRTTFDLRSFKTGHPEITDYDQYMKTSSIAGSLMVSIAG